MNSTPASLRGLRIDETSPSHLKANFKERLPFIDGLRAVSVLLVLLSHAPYATRAANHSGWLYSHGDLGVRVFFVISGFLITGQLLTELVERSSINLLNFYKKRAFRLMPVYWSYLVVLAVATVAQAYQDKATSWFGALTYTRNIFGAGDSATVHFWSLAVEEQFYFLWPLLIIGLLTLRTWRAFFILVAIAASFAILFRMNQCSPEHLCRLILGSRSILLYMDSILIGCLTGAAWLIRARGDRELIGSCWVRILVLILLLTSTTSFWPQLGSVTPCIQALLIGSYLYSVLAQPTRTEVRLLENTLPVYIGKLSYSIYVWHFLFLGHYNNGLFGPFQRHIETYWLATTFLTAIASFHLLETPLRRYLNERYLSRPAPAMASPQSTTS